MQRVETAWIEPTDEDYNLIYRVFGTSDAEVTGLLLPPGTDEETLDLEAKALLQSMGFDVTGLDIEISTG